MPPSRLFVVCCIGFLIAVFLASVNGSSSIEGVSISNWWNFELPLQTVAGFGIGISFILILGEIVFKSFGKIMFVCAVLLCFFVGLWRHEQVKQVSEFSNMLGIKQEWEGLVVDDVDVRLTSQQLTVRLDGVSQNILVVTDQGKDIRYGDRVWLTGQLIEPEKFAGSEFDYKEYLKMHGIYALMRRPRVVVLDRGQGNPIKSFLYTVKKTALIQIQRYVSEPQSSLLVGILIGAQKTVPEEIVEQFNRTGLSHIVAVSGYNISIIILYLGFLGKWLGRRWGAVISFLVIIGFVVLTGAGPSIVRAGIMGSMVLLAGLVGRPYSVTPSLVASAAVMVFINPKILMWDKGFQLSFAATAGVIYVTPYLEKWFKSWPDPLEIKTILLGTAGATWFTWPILVEGFGRVSMVAPLANLLVLPLIPWLMLFGFLGLLPGLGAGFSYVANLLLVYILKVLEWLSSWNWASVDIQSSTLLFLMCIVVSVAGYYLLVLLTKARQKNQSSFTKFTSKEQDRALNRFS